MGRVIHELKHHIPFTVFSAVAAIILIAFFSVAMSAILAGSGARAPSGEHAHGVGLLGSSLYELFHVFHPIHVLFSATATTAMFWRFDRNPFKAVIIGLVGSLGICALSDIIFPFIGGTLIGSEMHLHVCLVEHPMQVIPMAFFGIAIGFIAAEVFLDRKSTIFSHSGHIFVSSIASLVYLIAFGFTEWMENISLVFVILVLAVIIPCCTSDIIFPLLFIRKESREMLSPCCGSAEHIKEKGRHDH